MLLALLGSYTYVMRSEWEEQTPASVALLAAIVALDVLLTIVAIVNVFYLLPPEMSRRFMGTLTAIVSPVWTSLFLLNAKSPSLA
jgi:hypothetical protein